MAIENENNETVSELDVEVEFERLLQAYSNRLSADEVIRNMDSIKRQAREHAEGRKLLLQEALRTKIEVPEQEIENELLTMVERLGGEQAFSAHLSKKGLSREQMTTMTRNAILIEKLIAAVTSAVPEAGNEEVSDFFESNREALPGNVSFEQARDLIRTALTNAARNKRLLEFIGTLKKTPETV